MNHRVVRQHRHEGLDAPFTQVLAERVFAGDALISANGSAPYQAVYGCVPLMLPDISSSIDDAQPGTGRHVLRLRELAVQNTVEGTARARISRAMNTKTR
eukprot:12117948-Alexandrium_andersonii.AAC.1